MRINGKAEGYAYKSGVSSDATTILPQSPAHSDVVLLLEIYNYNGYCLFHRVKDHYPDRR
jgi:hypothetical protein